MKDYAKHEFLDKQYERKHISTLVPIIALAILIPLYLIGRKQILGF